MEQWPATKVRDTFLNFFEEKGHEFVPSSSVIPFNDPTLLFTNAGMNQYKSIFLGTADPNSSFAQLRRATNSQKCIRAGGKHNDLDDVGKDSYHHTFFEMLGNWSFGDYFKKEAIDFAWELLTSRFGLDPARLYVTYFEGSSDIGLDPDEEARELWRAVGVPDDHIIPGNMKDNFWEMGDQGPCGPCIELHYDLVGNRNAAHLVNQDDPMVIEIWNVVFIQFNREPSRELRVLPSKHIDTGLGFERLVSVLQGKFSNYDTDIFAPLFTKIQHITKARPYQGKFGDEDVDSIDTAYRVIADHVRTSVIAISDGVVPNNVGRGYIVRRIVRRGARYARKYFNAEIGSFLSKIVPTAVELLGGIFPEIYEKEEEIKELLDEEEAAFALSLDRGEAMFSKYAQACRTQGSTRLTGDHVWRLYDTYGFPVDLTKLMAEEQGLTIDDKEVSVAQEKAREASRGGKKDVNAATALDVHDLAILESNRNVPPTDDSAKYAKGTIESVVKGLYYAKKFVESTSAVPEGEQFGIILDRTNFYAESGGQEFDTGRLITEGVTEVEITNVQAYGAYVLHSGYLKHGLLSLGDKVLAEYDELRRQRIRLNHTGTHILNLALRDVLGRDIDQRGSLVSSEKLRFDFSHKSAVTDAQIQNIETIANRQIHDDLAVFTSNVQLSTASQIQGVRAVFGETYPDPVRVVSIGVPVNELTSNVSAEDWWKYSIEFCGGTHVERTGEIKKLVVLEESGIAKGIRRIVAVTGYTAAEAQHLADSFKHERLDQLERMPFSYEKEKCVKEAQSELAKLSISTLTKKDIATRLNKIAKDVIKEQKEAQKAEADSVIQLIRTHFERNKDSTSYVAGIPTSLSAKTVSDVIKYISVNNTDKSVYLIGVDNSTGKIPHGCSVAPEHEAKGLTASEWVAQVADVVGGGKAGGQGSTSIGNGVNTFSYEEAIKAAAEFLGRLGI